MHHFRSFLRASLATRVLGVALALVTVWNLGCASSQPLLASMLGANGGGMVCDSEGMIVAPSNGQAIGAEERAQGDSEDLANAVAASTDSQAIVSASPDDSGSRTPPAICGCQSCAATPTPAETISVPTSSLPEIAALTLVTPPSIARPPLVPPPQAEL